jgi:UTP--glucose-1-phosphate uridylyltransferase
MLAQLLERGYRYAFMSNSDNLGAVLDPRILAWFAAERMPVRVRGDRPHGGRPQGRPHRAAQGDGG